jgi:hypothetical protein
MSIADTDHWDDSDGAMMSKQVHIKLNQTFTQRMSQKNALMKSDKHKMPVLVQRSYWLLVGFPKINQAPEQQ